MPEYACQILPEFRIGPHRNRRRIESEWLRSDRDGVGTDGVGLEILNHFPARLAEVRSFAPGSLR
jgi:hypothetical protein